MQQPHTAPLWTWILPLGGIAYFLVATFGGLESNGSSTAGTLFSLALIPVLIGAIFSAVHHAEEIAHTTGEPFGTLVLTVAVTVIEVALILSVMATGDSAPELVRDTVYSVVMIVCNGLVGICILVGGLRYREQAFDVTSGSIYIAVLIVLATLTLILPNYTSSAPGPTFSGSQLAFISVVAILLYLVFLYTQTVRHRDYFTGSAVSADGAPASSRILVVSGLALVLALSAVVLLSKKFATIVDQGLALAGAPDAVAGVIIALLILSPESMAAIRAARQDNLQKSLNLALGSSLATIGLTIPAVAAANVFMQHKLVLGLPQKETVLLLMTLAASIVTFSTGRTNVLFGFLHLVIFGTFIFLVFVP